MYWCITVCRISLLVTHTCMLLVYGRSCCISVVLIFFLTGIERTEAKRGEGNSKHDNNDNHNSNSNNSSNNNNHTNNQIHTVD